MTVPWYQTGRGKWAVVIFLLFVGFLIYFAVTGGGTTAWCVDHMYDQGFRGPDLTKMTEACTANPPPGAP